MLLVLKTFYRAKALILEESLNGVRGDVNLISSQHNRELRSTKNRLTSGIKTEFQEFFRCHTLFVGAQIGIHFGFSHENP